MTPKRELQLAYGLAIILLILGILTYAAFPAKKPDQPLRLMYKVTAGNVLFDHKTHSTAAGYGLSCQDCHHHPQEEETDFRACIDCHSVPPEGQSFPNTCEDCHAPDEIEDTEITKRSDAFHAQCINCHKDYEAGPQECSLCHMTPK